ncbi:2561_t:CDS:2 [Funneliformis mosseae]|uniref:2561_t:CDS:1 n=1 Tax=Funneliformis mosseae TaxID=27381 RepID=A0A9N9CXL0_FUNMO|nr:2561_t:CDS:2 [Funneliformis mosseae]
MSSAELGQLACFQILNGSTSYAITRNILRITTSITHDFVWNDRNTEQLDETQKIRFAVPIQDLLPKLYIRVIS